MNKKEKQERNKKIIEEYKNGSSSLQLSEKYNMSYSGILYVLKTAGVKRRSNKENSRKYSLDEKFFEVIDTEEKAYWLGFIYADGYISINNNQKVFGITLSSSDKEHLEAFKKSIKSIYPIHDYISSNSYKIGTEYSRIAMTSDKMVDDLIKLGVIEHKTNVLTFPTEEQVPKHLIHHFIRGYFDGDGCITCYKCGGYDRYKTCFIGTYDFLNSINNIINESCKIKIPKLYKRREEQEVYSLEYSSNKRSKELYKFMYKNSTIYLNRKRNKFSRLIEKDNL